MIRDLTKEKIDQIAEGSETGADLILKLYREVIPVWSKLESGVVGGRYRFPIVSKETWMYICGKIQALSPAAGFLWINKGFTSDQSGHMPDWYICIDNGLIRKGA